MWQRSAQMFFIGTMARDELSSNSAFLQVDRCCYTGDATADNRDF
jgi:hypothetical protein